jgi:triosephosphate isomerase
MKKERKLIIAGNWKMNKTVAEALDLVRDLKTELAKIEDVDIVVFSPFTALLCRKVFPVYSNFRKSHRGGTENPERESSK